MEKDEIRRFDSFQAFEEICSLAAQKKVGRSSGFLCVHSVAGHSLFAV
jgi:hypothetical protein